MKESVMPPKPPEYFIQTPRGQEGPMTSDAVIERYRSGNLKDSTLVWKEGLPEWVPLSVEFAAAIRTANPVSASGAPQIVVQSPSHGADYQQAMAATKSYVGSAVIVLLLDFLCCWPLGLVFNIMWYLEACKMERLSGSAPAGKGCLLAMLIATAVSVIAFIGLFILMMITSASVQSSLYKGV